MTTEIRGILAAITTPFTADGSALDEPAMHAQINRLVDAGIHGVVPTGTTGEFMTLTLSTSCFLCPYKFPESIRTLQARTWQLNIHEMLWRIPDVVNRTFSPRNLDCDDPSILEEYLDLIIKKLFL